MKKLAVLLLLLVGALGVAWRARDRGQSIMFDRVWVDRLPKSETDAIQIFAAVRSEAVGLFDARSAWKGQWELFRWEARGDGQLELLYPQSASKQRASYRAWKCNEQRDFDFCLELSGGKGAKKYYSQRGWEIGSVDGARAIERKLDGIARKLDGIAGTLGR
jgi:hypothetical protein